MRAAPSGMAACPRATRPAPAATPILRTTRPSTTAQPTTQRALRSSSRDAPPTARRRSWPRRALGCALPARIAAHRRAGAASQTELRARAPTAPRASRTATARKAATRTLRWQRAAPPPDAARRCRLRCRHHPRRRHRWRPRRQEATRLHRLLPRRLRRRRHRHRCRRCSGSATSLCWWQTRITMSLMSSSCTRWPTAKRCTAGAAQLRPFGRRPQ